MTRRPVIAMSLVFLAALGVAVWWTSRPGDTPSSDADARDPPAAEAATSGKPRPTGPVGSPTPTDAGRSSVAVAALLSTLPAAGTDPRRIVDALLPAADAGDRRAACRVAIELMTCQHAAAMVGERWVRGESTAFGGPEVDERTVRTDAAIAAVDARCQEVPAATRARTAELLGAAARAGEPDAALLYAEGYHLRGHTVFDFAAHPGFDRWRAEAESLLRRQLRAGDRRAVYRLAMATSNDFGLLDGLVDDDPTTSRAMWMLNRQLTGRGHGGLPGARLPPAEERRAVELAERLHREYFESRIHDEDESTATLVPPMPWFDGWTEPERCTGAIPR